MVCVLRSENKVARKQGTFHHGSNSDFQRSVGFGSGEKSNGGSRGQSCKEGTPKSTREAGASSVPRTSRGSRAGRPLGWGDFACGAKGPQPDGAPDPQGWEGPGRTREIASKRLQQGWQRGAGSEWQALPPPPSTPISLPFPGPPSLPLQEGSAVNKLL